MEPDYIINGQAHGDIASRLLACNFDTGVLRPWLGRDGRSYVTVTNAEGKPENRLLTNSVATLRKDDWIMLDEAIIRAAQPRLRTFGDLRAAGLQFVIPNGMAKTVLEYQTQSDITDADISMDGLRKSEADRPQYELAGLPLPIIHKDFSFPARQIMTSRNSNTPLDTTMAELAARKVAEQIERMTLGVGNTFSYAGHSIYGYTNFPQRLTTELTDPTGQGWKPADTVRDVLEMRKESQDAHYYGPWVLYCGTEWDLHLDDDYSDAKGDNTLRQRIMQISGIQDVRTADYLPGYDMVLVQQSSDVARAVVGMEIRTLQWESHGGLQQNFKVMAIMVPQVRADYNGNTGIVHATVAEGT